MLAIKSRLDRLERLTSDCTNSQSIDIKTLLAEPYKAIHKDIQEGKHEFYNLPGGRGSCKSSFCSLEMINGIMEDKTQMSNGLVVRKYAVTLRGSVYAQIQWAIDVLGVSNKWKATINPLQFVYVPTGQTIRLTGLDDAQKLKSLKATHGYFKYLWFEEFSEITGELELRSIQQSVLRGGNKFVVLRSFNPPISKSNWANEFVSIPDSRALTVLTDYTQIPREWLGESFFLEAERLKEINPQAYKHEYLGLAIGNGSEVFPNLEIRTITDEEINNFEYLYQGVDFGFAVDPCCFLTVAYSHKYDTIYILDEIYERGLSNKELARKIKERKYYIQSDYVVCDCAEPKSIEDLRTEGIYARSCYKAPGCIEYRIRWLQHRKIVIDPKRTPNAHREFVHYGYEIDKNGVVMSKLPDKDNHSIDCLGYSLNSLIWRKNEIIA